MRWLLGLWLCCGCNQVFGLQATVSVDAAYFDAPPDAPWACPTDQSLPRFSRAFHQIDIGLTYCTDYTVSSTRGLATAYCRVVSGSASVFQGPIDGQLVPSVGLVPSLSMRFVDEPRLNPEGDEVWLRQVSTLGATDPSRFSVYRADGDNWAWSADLAVPVTADRGDEISAPTRRSAGPRRFIFNTPSDDRMLEMEEGNPVPIHSYRNVDLGMSYIMRPTISADGLRLVFGGSRMTDLLVTTMYSARTSINDRFGPATPLEDAPAATDPFLTEDCGKLYASGLGRSSGNDGRNSERTVSRFRSPSRCSS